MCDPITTMSIPPLAIVQTVSTDGDRKPAVVSVRRLPITDTLRCFDKAIILWLRGAGLNQGFSSPPQPTFCALDSYWTSMRAKQPCARHCRPRPTDIACRQNAMEGDNATNVSTVYRGLTSRVDVRCGRMGLWAGSAAAVSVASARSSRSDHFGKRYWLPRGSTGNGDSGQTHGDLGCSSQRPVD